MSIVDIAGGAGGLLATIEKNYPEKHRLTLYDQPSVIDDINRTNGDRKKIWHAIAGNFFKPRGENKLPEDQDLYLIKGTPVRVPMA